MLITFLIFLAISQYDKAAEVAGDKLQSIPASLTLGEMKLTFINQNKTSATTENQRSTVTVIQAKGQTAVLLHQYGHYVHVFLRKILICYYLPLHFLNRELLLIWLFLICF